MGSLYQRGRVWWIKYYVNGRPMRESARTTKETEARRLLRQREGDTERGIPVSPHVGRVKFEELADDLLREYRTNNRASLKDTQRRLRLHLTPFFMGRRMAGITTVDVRRFIERRQEAGASNAEINRELAVLRRMFTLGCEGGKLLHRPHIPMLREANIRTGFFEPEQFRAVLRHLPEPLRPLVVFAYITGWRVPSEVLPLRWAQVDLEAGIVRLEPGTTKNQEGRTFPLLPELRAVLRAQRALTETLQRQTGRILPWVFHRLGVPIRDFRKAWQTACERAGCPGRIPHDFRRTAVRNLVRSGVPERVAMVLTGHKTRSVFERYNIVSEQDLREAARKLAGTISGTIGPLLPGLADGDTLQLLDSSYGEAHRIPVGLPDFKSGVRL